MAYEYLNETTDAMFAKLSPSSFTGIDVALMFYEYTLIKPKFKTQRWYFQTKLAEWNPSFCKGYFGKRQRELYPSVKNKLYGTNN